jgi:DNA-directed RNA polymerase subunit RPC12/RpoP
MSYKCGKCGYVVDSLSEGLVRCPSCAYKILYKTRQPIAKNVIAK